MGLLVGGSAEAGDGSIGHAIGGAVSPLWLAPFVLLVAAIAILPLLAARRWEKNSTKALLCLLLGAPVLAMLLSTGEAGARQVAHTARDYVSFIVLLGSLFVVAGGVLLRGRLRATPLANAALLAFGALLASFVGTTGASMLLIRPLLRANGGRAGTAVVVVFFIFLVGNIGGSLTPLGDPPLFLGFLKGVPFEWTFCLLPQWAVATAAVLAIFLVVDTIGSRREARAGALEPGGSNGPAVARTSGLGIESSSASVPAAHEPIRIDGAINIVLLGGILAAAYLSGRHHWPWGAAEGVMAGLAILSLLLTPKVVRSENRFTFGPIVEVAVLFAGIFATMIPALLILNARAGDIGISQPWHFFWATGSLSSFLDHAPTYLTFLSVAQGLPGADAPGALLLEDGPISPTLLKAISCGAVFMGANSYIGNGPNLMVKAVAEENGVEMPSFLGFMGYSTAILVPTFVLLTFLFFA